MRFTLWFWHVFLSLDFLNVFMLFYSSIFYLCKNHGGLKTRFFAFLVFFFFDIHRRAYRCHWPSVRISDPRPDKIQATDNVFITVTPIFGRCFRLFNRPSEADWQIYAWKTAKKCWFLLYIFSVFFDVGKPLWWCHWLQIRFPQKTWQKTSVQQH